MRWYEIGDGIDNPEALARLDAVEQRYGAKQSPVMQEASGT